MPDAGFTIRQVRGDIDKLSRQLKTEARRKLRKELRAVLVTESKPARAAIKKAAREKLPQGGGLAKWAAVTPSLKTKFEGDRAAVTISMKKAGHDIRSLDRGKVRHPLYGNRKHWFQEQVTPGFFTETVAREEAELKRRVAGALSKFFDDL